VEFVLAVSKKKNCNTEQDVFKLIEHGLKNQTFLEKEYNIESSKAQSVFVIHCQKYSQSFTTTVNCTYFIDLADSEASKKVESKDRKLEKAYTAINTVVDANLVTNDWSQIPYQNSKLTSLVNDMFTMSCKTLLITCVKDTNTSETLSTLKFGSAAKSILKFQQGKTRVNEIPEEKSELNHVSTGTVTSKEVNNFISLLDPKKKIEDGTEIIFQLSIEKTEEYLNNIRKELEKFTILMKVATETMELDLLSAQNEIGSTIPSAYLSNYKLEEAKKELKTVSLREKKVLVNHPITAKSKVSLNINHKKSACNNILFTQTKSIDSTHDPSLLNLETNETTIMEQNSSDVSTSSKIMHKKEPIRVNLRLRPMETENNKKAESCFQLNTDCRNFTYKFPLGEENHFCYNRTFDENTSQSDIYQSSCASVVSDLIQGINHSIITLGQSESGKTYTLWGTFQDYESDGKCGVLSPVNKSSGLGIRIISNLFERILDYPQSIEFTLRCSYLSIYLDNIYDLLEPNKRKIIQPISYTDTIPKSGELNEPYCFDEHNLLSLIQRGQSSLSFLSKCMKADRNLFHSIFCLAIEKKDTQTGKIKYSRLHLVDTARFVMKTNKILKHEVKITQESFLAIGSVIQCIHEKKDLVPFSDSKLTTFLEEDLSGNFITTMFITASLNSYKMTDSISAIRLGQLASQLCTSPRINKDLLLSYYRKKILTADIKYKEQTILLHQLARNILQSEEIINGSTLNLSSSILASLQAVVKEEFFCDQSRSSFPCGTTKETNDSDVQLNSLSLQQEQKLLRNYAKSEDKTCILPILPILARQRQNEFKEKELKEKEKELKTLHQDVQKNKVSISKLESDLDKCQYRYKKGQHFLEHLRKIVLKLQRANENKLDTSKLTSYVTGSPVLSNLLDFDSLLLKVDLVDSKRIKKSGDVNNIDTEVESTSGSLYSHERKKKLNKMNGTMNEEYNDGCNNKKNSNYVSINCTEFDDLCKNVEKCEPSTEDTTRQTDKELELILDLSNMANKCNELQLLLSVERENIDLLSNRSGSLIKPSLYIINQEVISLRKGKDAMMKKAKTAVDKLQELQTENIVLEKKSSITINRMFSLEHDFQRIQETLRRKIIDTHDADSKLREKLTEFESVVDECLVVPQNCVNTQRINLPLRGKIPSKKNKILMDENLKKSCCCLILAPSMKRSIQTPSVTLSSRQHLHWKYRYRKNLTTRFRRRRKLGKVIFKPGENIIKPCNRMMFKWI